MRRKARGPKPKKQPKWMLPLGINLGVSAVCLLIAPPAWIIVIPLESLPLEEQTEDMCLAVYLQAQCLVGDEVITNDSAQPLNEWVSAGATGKLLGGGDGAKARVTERW